MAELQARSLNHPEITREFDNGTNAQVHIGGRMVTRTEFRPGWRWVNDGRPIAGGASCQVHHVGYRVSGSLHVETDGTETCTVLEWAAGSASYAAPAAATAGTSA